MVQKTKKKLAKSSLIIYDNRIHTINLGHLSVLENNLLFTMFKHFKDSNVHRWYRDDLKYMALSSNSENCNINNTDITNIVKRIKEVIFKLDIIVRNENIDTYYNLFSSMNINYSPINREVIEYVEVVLNDNMELLFKDLENNFTILEEGEFKGFKSKYTQTLYRLLSENSYKGEMNIGYNTLLEQLGCPESYEYKMFHYRILKPSVEELSKIFKGLEYKVNKIKDDGKLMIHSIRFTFQRFAITQNEAYRAFVPNSSESKTTLFGLYKTRKRLVGQRNYNISNDKGCDEINIAINQIDKQIMKLQGRE